MSTPLRAAKPEPETPPEVPHWVPSTQLLGARGELWIRHRGATYRLRETASGKLLLTK